jgi:hypothetical protein
VTSDQPLLRVVRGDATEEEIAALVAVLTARAGGAVDVPPPPPSLWSQPVLRSTPHPGPGAWRASSLPR